MPAISGNLVVKSKLSRRSGSVALRQMNPIHKMQPSSFFGCLFFLPNLPQKKINSKKFVRRTIESETFTNNIFEKKIENQKTEIISPLESFFFFFCFRNTLKNSVKN